MKRNGSDYHISRRKLLGAASAAAISGLVFGGNIGYSRQGEGVGDSVYGNIADTALKGGSGNAAGIRRIAEEVVQEYKEEVTARLAEKGEETAVHFVQNPNLLNDHALLVTTGFYSAGDGGDAVYAVLPIEGDERWRAAGNGMELSDKGEIKSGNKKLSYYSSNDMNVNALGAVGDGTGDDTAAIQAAIDAAEAGATVFFSSGTYVVTSLKINKSVRFYSHEGTTLKFKSSLGIRTVMFEIQTNGIDVSFENIVFDGNKDNQTAPDQVNRLYYRIIYWVARDRPFVNDNSFLAIRKCKFLNTPSNAVFLIGYDDADKADVNQSLHLKIEDNYFEKGYENAPGHLDTSVISISGNCSGVISDNTFIKNEPISMYGLGAITISTADTTVEVFSSLVIRNNRFHQYGRQTTTGVGPIGVIDFYASCEQLIIDGNRFTDSYYAAIKGKTNSRKCVVTNNIVEGAYLNAKSVVKSFGISIGRGTYFGIYDNYTVSNNVIKHIYGNGIEIIGSNVGFSPAPVGKIKDVIITGNAVEVIADPGTPSYGVLVQHFENAVISNNILRNNDRAIYCNDCKVGAVISGNQLYDSKKMFIIFQGYNTGEPPYPDYDAELIVSNNLMRTTIDPGNLKFWCQYYEKVSNIVSSGNVVRLSGATAAEHFIRTGSSVLGHVSAHQNVVQGAVSAYFSLVSGAIVQSQNLHNGTIVS